MSKIEIENAFFTFNEKTYKAMTTRSRKVKSNFKQNMVSRASFIFSIFLAFFPHGIAATPASCCSVCECRAQEVWCEERGLTSIPVDIPSQIKRLYLFNNNISFIPDESLANLKVKNSILYELTKFWYCKRYYVRVTRKTCNNSCSFDKWHILRLEPVWEYIK